MTTRNGRAPGSARRRASSPWRCWPAAARQSTTCRCRRRRPCATACAPADNEVVWVEIGRDGRWRAEGEQQPLSLTPGAGLLDVDVAFPVLHGRFGEDGTVQGLLEMLGVLCRLGRGGVGAVHGQGAVQASRCRRRGHGPTGGLCRRPRGAHGAIRAAKRRSSARSPSWDCRCSSSPRAWAPRLASPG